MAAVAVELVTEVFSYAIPIAIVFEIGNLIVGTFMRAAFGGKLWLGGR